MTIHILEYPYPLAPKIRSKEAPDEPYLSLVWTLFGAEGVYGWGSIWLYEYHRLP